MTSATPERRFIREALLALGAERPGLREAARAVRDWEGVLATAAAGAVTEAIGSAAQLRGVDGEIPERAREALLEAHEGAIGRNALLLTEAAEIQEAFAAAGIDSVILKGPGLLVAHYPDIGARYVSDVDILVRQGDAERAQEIVRARGAGPLPHWLLPMEEGPDFHHLPSLVTARGMTVEIHVQLPGLATDEAGSAEILRRGRTVAWEGRPLRIPSEADLVLMLCLHVFAYHGGMAEYRLRHLADLAVLVGAGAVRWEAVEALCQDDAARASVRASRALLEEGRTGWDDWRYAVGVRARGWLHVAFGRGPGALRTVVFPPRSFMAGRYGVPPGSRLLPLLYLWRPVRGAWRLVTGR